MKLNELHDNEGARKSRMRVGRGIGSGKGKTGGRGVKGQKSRSGVSINGFEGGQMPIFRRLPKRGFKNPFSKDFAVINLSDVQRFVDAKRLDTKATVTTALLAEKGIVNPGKNGIKLLGRGELKTKLNFQLEAASKSAISGVEKAGGKVELPAASA